MLDSTELIRSGALLFYGGVVTQMLRHHDKRINRTEVTNAKLLKAVAKLKAKKKKEQHERIYRDKGRRR